MKSDACSGMSDDIEDLKSSVSNGKAAVASAITDKGISTSATATFNTMAANIRLLPDYEDRNLGTWSSTTDVENFFSAHNVENGFSGIHIGNYVTIQDGTYNQTWKVAGFTCEHNATASDGTVYDNGVGMLMIPKTQLTEYNWHTYYQTATPYMNSAIHSFINSTVYNALKTILGNHIVRRNVLLGSAQNNQVSSDQKKTTSAYTWTKSYLTLMSIGQMNGRFTYYTSKYDDGEANYKLPLFTYENFKTGYTFYSRCVWGYGSAGAFRAWLVNQDGGINFSYITSNASGVRPLMLLR